jgi:DNA methylase N-4/N-6 domain-containing protein|nr:MAG TPA: ParB protein [Caudoviricetes sp.]
MEERVEIKIDPRNYRIHGDKNKRLIHKSLVECGAGRSVLADRDNVLIAGNGVYEEAQKLGLKVRVVESDGTELIVIKRKDLSTEDEKRKMLALADNHTSDSSEFDWGLVIENFSSDILNDWEFSVDDIEFSTDIPNIDSEKDSNLYTKKIASPIYTPTGDKPAISELYNLETYNCLMKQIKECNLDKQTKDFLQIAASRHIVFDYGKIAEFYAHSDAIIQNLMEDSALVIIDFNKAIELGYVCLKKELSDSYLEDHNDDEK